MAHYARSWINSVFFHRRKKIDTEAAQLALTRGLAAIASMQRSDGSFPFLHRRKDEEWQECPSMFSTVTVLLAVGNFLPDEALSSGADFALSCRRRDGAWEYNPNLDIPACSDDTAFALAVIARKSSNLVTAADATLLRSFWRPDGGPFRTFQIGSGEEWSGRDRDDAVVNCNILFGLNEIGAPAKADEIDAVIGQTQRDQSGSRYYCSPMAISHAAVRAGISLDLLPPALLVRPNLKHGVLPTAQWLCARRIWDDDAVVHLLARQTKEGHWPVEALCRTVVPEYWGSPAVSTALCVEALQTAIEARRSSGSGS